MVENDNLEMTIEHLESIILFNVRNKELTLEQFATVQDIINRTSGQVFN